MDIVTAAAPPIFKNGYLVSCETTKEAVYIDPGDEVDELVADAQLSGLKVTMILLTHAHFDHITGVARAKSAFGAPIWLHRDDLFLYDGAMDQGRLFGMAVATQPPVDHFYAPGQRLTFGRYVVDVRHTPGHCPGGVCLAIGPADAAARELFVGDTLFAGSIGRTDLPGADHEQLLRSIREELLVYPDDTIVHSGHGPDTTIGVERTSNPFL
jgi:glyoxylase-like metal-dependent hydrolase (beta-lactamase superfamily II)